MARCIEIKFEKRGVSCVAELLDDLAPRTCEALWQALPQGDQAYHARFAQHEVYTLVRPFAEEELGLENPCIIPIPGDVLYFFFPPGVVYVKEAAYSNGVVDLAVFYGRDNFLFSPITGPCPGNRFATIIENFEGMAKACDNVWREGFAGEKLVFSRVE